MKHFFCCLYLCVFFNLQSLEFCWAHSIEIQSIRSVAHESILLSNKNGGNLVRDSLAFTPEEAISENLKWRKTYSEFSLAFHEYLTRCHPKGIDDLFSGYSLVTDMFYNLYTECIANHNNINAHYERGKILFDRGLYLESFSDIQPIIDSGKWDNPKADKKKSRELLLTVGQMQVETGAYEKAIDTLSELIKRDPQNKEAYFNRALAFFELGNFDQSIKDYILSNKSKSLSQIKSKVSSEFRDSLIKGLKEGGITAAKEFFPTLLNTARGLGETLWSTVQHPVNATTNFCNACYEVSVVSADFFRQLDLNQIDEYVDEFKQLCMEFDQLDDAKKGYCIGQIIGKYGIEIFAGGTALKGISTVRKLREANRICNIEAMILSEAKKNVIISSSIKFAAEREAYLKSIKINWDKQNKHIPGRHNFLKGRSEITLDAVELELLIKDNLGKGQIVIGELGVSGFKERVDFGKIIGEYALEIKGQPTLYFPTSKGIIVYAKDCSVHLIPSAP